MGGNRENGVPGHATGRGVEEEGRTARSLLDTYLPATVIDASFAQPGGAQLKE